MTPTAEEIAARIDRDRREREEEILLLLLLLFGQSYTHVRSALRVGADPFAAATDVILGNPTLGLPGLAPRLAPAMLRASYAGWRRMVLMVPSGEGRPPREADEDDYLLLLLLLSGYGYTPTVDYRDRARQAAGQMLQTLLGRINAGVAAGLSGVQQAFVAGGYRKASPSGAWALVTAATALAIGSYEDGYATGLGRDEVRDQLRGLRYVSVRDNRTSDICRARDAVRLPPSHPWLLENWPQLHFHCRSALIPIFHSFTATPESDLPYSPPPEPGFGRAPDAAFGFTFRAAQPGLFGRVA